VRFSQLKGRSIGVWGAGREVRSLANQLWRLPGAEITVAAFDTAPDAGALASLAAPAAQVVVGPGVVEALAGCDVVVRSPGVSIYKPEVQALIAAGTPVTTATSLWLSEHGSANVIGITGTKGKSTTASLAFHLARATGVDAALAGNIGHPALGLLDREPSPELVLHELSSYQIADLEIGTEVALVTSIFPEHVDWHGSDAVYRADKLKLLGLPGVRVAVVNDRFPELVAAAEAAESSVVFGVPEGWDASASGITHRGTKVLGAKDIPLPGEHNFVNLCGALAALEAVGVEPLLPEALKGFKPLAHRLEVVGESGGLLWVDDSISTTPESTLVALDSFPGREVVLLAGGFDRGQDYAVLGSALAARGAAVVGMPTTGGRVVAAARTAGVGIERAVEAADLESAVAAARALVGPGSVVLLSPAAPSYNRFRNFEERGKRFRTLAGWTDFSRRSQRAVGRRP
jgi:UDP-N-acetylmuramoylalanine--D-glutamate ligase